MNQLYDLGWVPVRRISAILSMITVIFCVSFPLDILKTWKKTGWMISLVKGDDKTQGEKAWILLDFEKRTFSRFWGEDNRSISSLGIHCFILLLSWIYLNIIIFLKISKYMMLLARFTMAPACCNQRPKEPALLHHSEKLHFVLHYLLLRDSALSIPPSP